MFTDSIKIYGGPDHVCIFNRTFYAVLIHDTIYRFEMLFKECANIEYDKLGSENSVFFRQYIKVKNIWNSKLCQSVPCQDDLNLTFGRIYF